MFRALLASLLVLCTGCPKAVRPETLARDKYCYTVAIGVAVMTDDDCLLYEAVDDVAWQVAERYDLVGDPRWAQLTVYFTERFVIDCGYVDGLGVWRHGKDAMGCTYMQRGEAYVSTWAVWSWPEVLRHELSHYAIFLNGNVDGAHRCLDNPEWCR